MTISKANIFGLILTGGMSSRMGKDKGTLSYHGKSQTDYCLELLSNHCEEVFFSCRQDQVDLPHLTNYKKIIDKYEIKGPMNGILSALKEHSDKYWLVLAIDLPYLTDEIISELIESINIEKIATCYENPEKGWPEPLCTIYSPKAIKEIEEYLSRDKKCPRKLLMESEIELLQIDSSNPLRNINTTEEFHQAKSELSGE